MTVGELPSHKHVFQAAGQNNTSKWAPSATKGPTNDYETAYCGGNGYHNNISPVMAVYCWRRIS